MKLPTTPNNIIFFGTLGVFSYAVLKYLLDKGEPISGVVIPGVAPLQAPLDRMTKISVMQSPEHPTIEQLTLRHGIKTHYISDINSLATETLLREIQANFFLVACFPYIFPKKIYGLPKYACLNLHPSLLPAYKGPQPIFWQLRHGETKTGVSLHTIAAQIDSGDIVVQKEIQLSDGMRGRALHNLLGTIAAKLFIHSRPKFLANKVRTRRQNAHNESYMSVPSKNDFRIEPHWSARQAFNFMRGTEEWGIHYPIKLQDTEMQLKKAIAYTPSTPFDDITHIEDNRVFLQLKSGTLQAVLA